MTNEISQPRNAFDRSLSVEPEEGTTVYVPIPHGLNESASVAYNRSMRETYFERGLLFANDVLACEQAKRMLGVNNLIQDVVRVLRQNPDIRRTAEYTALSQQLNYFGVFDHNNPTTVRVWVDTFQEPTRSVLLTQFSNEELDSSDLNDELMHKALQGINKSHRDYEL